MPQFRPRPSVGGFRQAPAGDIGGAISRAGQRLGRAQAQRAAEDEALAKEHDRLQRIQTDKLDKSRVIKLRAEKQMARNTEIARISDEARSNGDYSTVPQQLDAWDSTYDSEMLQSESPGVQEIFPTADAPARSGKLNQMFTTQAAGNFEVMQNDYADTLDSLVQSTTPDMTSAEVVEPFNEAATGATSLGFLPGEATAKADAAKDAAMSRWVLDQPITSGLAALTSDPNVRDTLDKSQRDTLRRSITAQKEVYNSSRALYGEAFLSSTGVNINSDFARGATEVDQIASLPEELPPGVRKEALDFIGVLHRNKQKQSAFSSEDKQANAALHKGFTNILLGDFRVLDSPADKNGNANEVRSAELGIDKDERNRRLIELGSRAAEIYRKASIQLSEGSMTKDDFVDLRFQMEPILNLSMKLTQDVETPVGFFQKTFDDSLNFFSFGLISTSVSNSVNSGDTTASVLVSEIRNDMSFGTGVLGNLPSEIKSDMSVRLVRMTLAEESMSETVSPDEATTRSNQLLEKAKLDYVREKFGIEGDAAQERAEQIFGARTTPQAPSTVSVESMAEIIRSDLGRNVSLESIESAAKTDPRFSQEAFDEAVSLAAPEVRQQDFVIVNDAGVVDEQGFEFIRQGEGLRLEAYQDSAGVWTIGYGHTKGVKEGDVITDEGADQFLQEDIQTHAEVMKRAVPNWSKLEQNEFNAVVSLFFNANKGRGVEKSNAIKALNTALAGGERDEAAIDEFMREAFDKDIGFTKFTNPKTNQLEVLDGLVNRRAAERELFLGNG